MAPRAEAEQALVPGIDELTASVYVVPTDAPEADGTIAWDSTTITVVRIRSGDSTGIGWTYGSAQCGEVVDSFLAPVVLGKSALDVTARWEEMVRAARNNGRQGAIGYAISAVDVALWDLKARLVGLPLHRLLGSARESVAVYGSGGFTSYSSDQLRGQLEGWLEQGIPRVKIKVGESWGTEVPRDIERIRQAREYIGETTALFVDANGGYTAKQAVRVMDAVADAGVTWLEEPVSSDDLDGLRRVRDAVSADVAAGEYGFDLVYFRRMCEALAVDCLQIDATRCGGITEWMRAAAVAASFGLEVSGHCAPNLHAHVAAATPNLRHLEWFHDHVRIESLFFDGALDPAGGLLRPADDRPGNGFSLREGDVARYRRS